MNRFHVETSVELNGTYVLGSAITAFAGAPDRLGQETGLYELPKGTEVEVRGEGFSDRTLNVRCGNRYYSVFCRDLASSTLTNEKRFLDPEQQRIAGGVTAG